MEQHEKELLEKIRQQSEDIEIPESLKPDRMEQKLNARKYKRRRKIYASVLAAAGCAAILGIAILYGGMQVQRMKREELAKSRNPVVKQDKKDRGIKVAESYEEIYEYIKVNEQQYGKADGFFEGIFERINGGMESDTANEASQNGAKTSDSASADYSRTNTREQDVDEADIVKTDGRYLYTVTEEMHEIGIVDTQGERLKKVTAIVPEDCEYIQEIYVKDNRLVVLYQRAYQKRGEGEEKYYWSPDEMMTAVYDISDIGSPTCINSFSQSGAYHTSRLNGDYLYVFSRYYAHGDCKQEEYKEYIPYVNDTILPLQKIMMPGTRNATSYLVVTSVDIKNPEKIIDTISVLTAGDECYVSPENIYLCERVYEKAETNTSIRKIHYQDGKMEGEAKTEVLGYLNDSFSIDEYNGYLRMVVTLQSANTNSAYVLDENLEMTGKIQGLAKDERVYSARFMGDIGYFVTFRETDPLFSVDFSDPADPKILGQLKIPGFSEYLHPYGDGLLLGIGREADDKNVTMDEVKLSMFDVSDPSNVKEIHKCVIENAYESPAFYNYKAVAIDRKKNIIGFSAYAENEKYYLYGYDQVKGFTCNLAEGMSRGYPEARGVYIGDVFYLVKGRIIESYDLQTFEKMDDVVL